MVCHCSVPDVFPQPDTAVFHPAKAEEALDAAFSPADRDVGGDTRGGRDGDGGGSAGDVQILDEPAAGQRGRPGRVEQAGIQRAFDAKRALWWTPMFGQPKGLIKV